MRRLPKAWGRAAHAHTPIRRTPNAETPTRRHAHTLRSFPFIRIPWFIDAVRRINDIFRGAT
jgi:hypothetical protein